MKKILFNALGATFVVQGLYEWLWNENEALSSLPFGLAAVCLVLATTIQKQDSGLGIFSRLETYEKVWLTVVIALILAIVGFFLWGIIDNFFPQINWKYFLSFVGVIITVLFSGRMAYYLWSIVCFFKLAKLFNPMEE